MTDSARTMPSTTVAGAVVALLESLGVRRAYGLTGGPIAPFCDALGRSRIRALHCRHESGAAFAALEDSLASGDLCAVFATTGPGITNALTGMCAARWEGGRVLLISAISSGHEVGRWAFQETSSVTLPFGALFGPGPIFHGGWTVERPDDLPAIATAIARGIRSRQGWVGHLGMSIATQRLPCDTAAAAVPRVWDTIDATELDRSVAMLNRRSFAIWTGFGARQAAPEVAELALRTGASVMSSPRGKGTFPEGHPQYVGVTGFGGHPSVKAFLANARPEVVLVLGSRLGEFTSFWDPDLVPPGGFIHVDVDPVAHGAAFPEAPTLRVHADVGTFVRALLPRLDARAPTAPAVERLEEARAPARAGGLVRMSELMRSVQRWIVDESDAIVFSEAGNSFAWATHTLRFPSPGRYRTSTGWGAMGHATCGVLGATLGSGATAVALVGDGAMLMQSELSTAVRYGVPAAWIVLNDGAYGMIEQGMRALGLRPLETALPATDFAAFAHALGARGLRVESEDALDDAMREAARTTDPLVIDVLIDPSEPAPFLRRIQSLLSQGGSPAETQTRSEGES